MTHTEREKKTKKTKNNDTAPEVCSCHLKELVRISFGHYMADIAQYAFSVSNCITRSGGVFNDLQDMEKLRGVIWSESCYKE